jgi:beta-phosphoglucomutase
MKAVIFDMDGVIVDTERIHEQAWRDFGERHGVTVTADIHQRMKGQTGADNVKLLLPDTTTEEAVELRKEKVQLFLQHLEGNIVEIPGFSDFFAELKQQNVPVAVATSAMRDRAELMLLKIGIYDKLEAVVTASDVARGKPHPDLFLEAAKQLGVEPGECVVFEDALAGIQAATAAGMIPILLWTNPQQDEIEGVARTYKDFTQVTVEEVLTL